MECRSSRNIVPLNVGGILPRLPDRAAAEDLVISGRESERGGEKKLERKSACKTVLEYLVERPVC
jgi:hypothetical protein